MTDSKKNKKSGRPWRDNIEAVTMAIIMAVFLKYFIIEAYKIPTGSMQPTLMGATFDDSGKGIFDRILVDKLSYHFRDPVRWEIVVFKYPLDRSKNFIKRICGMPDEELKIENGDLFARKDESEPYRVLRRPRPIQREILKRLDMECNWRVQPGSKGWTVDGSELVAEGPGAAVFPRTSPYVKDLHHDGYPGTMVSKLRRTARSSGEHHVGDLRIDGEVEARAECTAVLFQFKEGTRHYEMTIPGPAAPDDARPSIHVSDGSQSSPIEERTEFAEHPYRLRAGKNVDFGAQNLNDLLQLEVDGEVLVRMEIPAASDQRANITVRLEGGGAEFEDLQAYRDIYYTSDRAAVSSWKIGPEHYFMLGDNTQDSADSREWRLVGQRGSDGKVHFGNRRGNENPRKVTGRPAGTEVYFRDLYGERHVYLQSEIESVAGPEAPLVPRALITGRAILVFWPIVPSLDVYRLKWIH